MGLSQVRQIKDQQTQRVIRDIYETVQPLVGSRNDKKYVSQRDLVDLGLALRDPNGNLRNPVVDTATDTEKAFFDFANNKLPSLATSVTDNAGDIDDLENVFFSIDYTVGAEVLNVINIDLQVQNLAAADLSVAHSFDVYFSDLSTGLDFTASPPDTSVAATIGDVLDLTGTLTSFKLITDATGNVALDITETGAKTLYLVAVSYRNQLSVSPAITFV